MDKAFVGRRISQLLYSNRTSEYALSAAIGKSSSYINKITSGKSLPAMDAFFDICDYFDVTPEEFFRQEDEPERPLVKELVLEIRDFPEGDLRFMLDMAAKMQRRK